MFDRKKITQHFIDWEPVYLVAGGAVLITVGAATVGHSFGYAQGSASVKVLFNELIIDDKTLTVEKITTYLTNGCKQVLTKS